MVTPRSGPGLPPKKGIEIELLQAGAPHDLQQHLYGGNPGSMLPLSMSVNVLFPAIKLQTQRFRSSNGRELRCAVAPLDLFTKMVQVLYRCLDTIT